MSNGRNIWPGTPASRAFDGADHLATSSRAVVDRRRDAMVTMSSASAARNSGVSSLHDHEQLAGHFFFAQRRDRALHAAAADIEAGKIRMALQQVERRFMGDPPCSRLTIVSSTSNSGAYSRK